MSKWKRKPQEQEGTYFFSGQFYITRGVQELLIPEEVHRIYLEIQQLVEEQEGLDYLQVYVHEDTGQIASFLNFGINSSNTLKSQLGIELFSWK